MENAVKALLIVAGVLIGVMILSLGVSLYTSLNQYVEYNQQEIVNREIQQFNDQFFKYVNCESLSDSNDVDFILTIHDIVTAANTAYENNLEYGLTEIGYVEGNYYVEINALGETNLEQTINTNMATLLEQNLNNNYRCTRADVELDPVTGRVFRVTFH